MKSHKLLLCICSLVFHRQFAHCNENLKHFTFCSQLIYNKVATIKQHRLCQVRLLLSFNNTIRDNIKSPKWFFNLILKKKTFEHATILNTPSFWMPFEMKTLRWTDRQMDGSTQPIGINWATKFHDLRYHSYRDMNYCLIKFGPVTDRRKVVHKSLYHA